ncbi:MAG: alpha/beta hydrolase [Trueperaceae bacterium]
MRAIEPNHGGFAINPHDGVRSYYEVYGPEDARRTLVLLPSWSLVHSRVWKMQVPYFARNGMRVVTFDGRGNGASDRPENGYAAEDFARDTVAVMDAAGVDRAVLLAFSAGGRWAAHVAVDHPERVERLVMVAPSVYLQGLVRMPLEAFLDAPADREGWNKYNAVHWRDDYRDFTAWFAEQVFSEPHSTKGIDDIVEWSRGTTPDMLIRTVVEGLTPKMREVWQKIACPVFIIHGSDDKIAPLANSHALQAALPHAELVVIDGGGHAPHLRDPVKVNLILRAYLEREARGVPRAEVAHVVG